MGKVLIISCKSNIEWTARTLTGVRGSCPPWGVELAAIPGWEGVVEPAAPMCCCWRGLLEPGPCPSWFCGRDKGGASCGAPGVCGCGVWDPANLGGVWWGVGERLCAGEGELPRMAPKWGMELGCWFVFDDVTDEAEAGPPPPTLWGPIGPTADTPPGPPTEPGCARGLGTERDGGVPMGGWGQTKGCGFKNTNLQVWNTWSKSEFSAFSDSTLFPRQKPCSTSTTICVKKIETALMTVSAQSHMHLIVIMEAQKDVCPQSCDSCR